MLKEMVIKHITERAIAKSSSSIIKLVIGSEIDKIIREKDGLIDALIESYFNQSQLRYVWFTPVTDFNHFVGKFVKKIEEI